MISPEMMPTLRKLWSAGLGALDCAEELGLTGPPLELREAVLRAIESDVRPGPKPKMPVRAKPVEQKPKTAPRPKATPKPKAARAPIVEDDDEDLDLGALITPEADLVIPVEQRRSILGPPYSQYQGMPVASPFGGATPQPLCRWPVGEPGTPEFFFCGAVARDGRPYCAGHCARAGAGYFGNRGFKAA